MAKKNAKNPEELRKILREQGMEDEPIEKCVKAMFGEEDEDEMSPTANHEAEESDEEEEAEEKGKKKTEKSLTATDLNKVMESFSTGIEKLAKSLTDNYEADSESDDDFDDTDLEKSFGTDDDTNETTVLIDISAVEESLCEVSKGVDSSMALVKSLIEAQMTQMKGDQSVIKEVREMRKSMADINEKLELLTKQPDGLAKALFNKPEDKKLKSVGDDEYARKINKAMDAVNDGKISGKDYKDYFDAMKFPNDSRSPEIIKSVEAAINRV